VEAATVQVAAMAATWAVVVAAVVLPSARAGRSQLVEVPTCRAAADI